MIDTATSERRTLKFSCQNCIVGDINKLAGGSVRATGNWSAGRIVQHIADAINLSIDGFGMTAPLHIRLGARLMRNKILNDPMRSGIRLPRRFESMLPPEMISFEEAADNLRAAVKRLDAEQMTAKNPLLGNLSHQEWMKFHCRHAEMHFSFLQPVEDAG